MNEDEIISQEKILGSWSMKPIKQNNYVPLLKKTLVLKQTEERQHQTVQRSQPAIQRR